MGTHEESSGHLMSYDEFAADPEMAIDNANASGKPFLVTQGGRFIVAVSPLQHPESHEDAALEE
jgi:hypothetical protein